MTQQYPPASGSVTTYTYDKSGCLKAITIDGVRRPVPRRRKAPKRRPKPEGDANA